MFEWLIHLVDDARIAYASIGYERECKKQWVADADHTYSTAHLEKDINTLLAEPLRHILSAFDIPIRALESRRENACLVVSDAKKKLAILERSYKAELDAAYKAKNEASEALEECRRELSVAYDDLNSAKSSLDS